MNKYKKILLNLIKITNSKNEVVYQAVNDDMFDNIAATESAYQYIIDPEKRKSLLFKMENLGEVEIYINE